MKRDLWEGGHRVPFLARWPGRIEHGRRSDEIICHTDLMATVAAILGAALPADAGEDSVNILPALLGRPTGQPLREATVHQSGSGRFAIRRGSLVFIDAPTGDDNREPDWFKAERGYRPTTGRASCMTSPTTSASATTSTPIDPETVKELKALLEKYRREGRSVARSP